MDNLSFTPKGIRREAQGLLADNWTRALATLCLSLFALAAFLVFNRLVTALIGVAEGGSDAQTEVTQLNSLLDYYEYYSSRGFRFTYIINLILTAFYFMLSAPLNMGIVKWYQSVAQCGDLKVGQVFHYYRDNQRFTDALSFEVNRLVRHVIVGGLCAAPSLVCFSRALSAAVDGKSGAGSVALLGGVLLLVGLLVYAFIMLRWFVARYLFTAGIRQSVARCFSTSAEFMRGHVFKVLRVYISLLPLILSCLLVAPIVYAVPVINASLAACAQDIIDSRTAA
ncbi:MAG: hypothetical protein E7559_01825 [Ruminococcaceae bacterium]|nr:hypothetical protein [Oscillospiraceae bacterium]